MNRIEKKFAELKAAKRKALIVFVSAGDPNLGTTEQLVPALFAAGADIVEIGIPFSDPMADGPVIQASYVRALKKGTALGGILAMTKRIRPLCNGGIVYMSAFNLIFHHGVKAFARHAAQAGVDGVIIPDIIPEEGDEIVRELDKHGIAPILLSAPTSGPERIRKIAAHTRGFLYYISVTGITGKQKPSVESVKKQVLMIKRQTKLPVAVGFGISSPADAAAMAKVADGVIIGSAAVKILSEKGTREETVRRVCAFVRSVRRAMDA
ncbi:MAG: tryptophan synthase subunit alpha [Nitrospinae bacterium]|nr:tryptophan synthase subunit alpha [Nitrospinota bacterium]